MSLKLNFNISQCQCDEFTYTETTGSGTNGWGSPNPGLGDAESAELVIKFPDDSEVEFDLSANFPTDDDQLEAIISMSDLSLSGKFPDGIYLFTYNVVVDGDSYTKSCYVLFDCQAKCCVDKLFAKIKSTDCGNCSESKLRQAYDADAFLKAAENAASCGKLTQAKELLSKVEFLCNNENCNC